MPLALLSNWRLILGAVLLAAIVGLGWFAKHQTEALGAERSARATAEAVAANNAEQVEVLQAAMLQREQAVANAQAKQAAAEKRAASIIEEVRNAQDGPIAPALSVALERLRADRGNPQGAVGQGGGASTANRAN